MNIERLTDSKYIVFMNLPETNRLKALARTFYHGNKAAALSEAIKEGVELGLCVKDMLESKDNQDLLAKRFCETQKDKVDRLWKEQTDGHKSTD